MQFNQGRKIFQELVTEYVTRLQQLTVGYGYGGCYDTYFPQWQLPLYSCIVDWSSWADMVALYNLMVLEKCARNRCREFFEYQSRYDQTGIIFIIFLSRRAPNLGTELLVNTPPLAP